MKMQGLFEAHERRKLFYPNDHGVSAGLLDYSSTKSAIVSLTRALALKLINEGIGVNAEAPGPLWTPLQPAFACLEGSKLWVWVSNGQGRTAIRDCTLFCLPDI